MELKMLVFEHYKGFEGDLVLSKIWTFEADFDSTYVKKVSVATKTRLKIVNTY